MKNIIIAALLGLSSASAMAQMAGSKEISPSHQGERIRLGSISASVGTIDELTRKLAIKAEAAGADYFRITHMNTRNMGYATATIYNDAGAKSYSGMNDK